MAIFPLLMVLMVIARVECSNDTEEDHYNGPEEVLRYHLFLKYDKHVRPLDPTIVNLRINIKHFDLHEESQTLMADAWMSNEWLDPRLSWYPKQFSGVSQITVPFEKLWTPDLGIYNSGSVGEELTYANSMTLVSASGKVLSAPTVKLHFTCVMDLTYWPHDTHKCTCMIGSWMHNGYEIDLRTKDDKPKIELPIRYTAIGLNLTRSEWKLLESNLTRKIQMYQEVPYITVSMSMTVTREAPAYEWIIKGPAVGLSILTLVLFVLPPAAGEKIIFGALCLLLDMAYIAFTSHTISLAPSHLPLIVELICKQAILVIASIAVSAISLRFARDPHTKGLPSFIKTPLLVLTSCLCLQSYKNLVSRDHHYMLKLGDFDFNENGNGHIYTKDISTDWLLLSAFMDRICLILFSIIFVINIYNFCEVL